jgi:hypothetical protein
MSVNKCNKKLYLLNLVDLLLDCNNPGYFKDDMKEITRIAFTSPKDGHHSDELNQYLDWRKEFKPMDEIDSGYEHFLRCMVQVCHCPCRDNPPVERKWVKKLL